jgi:hypothetical protein
VWPSAYKVLRVAAFFLNVDLVFFFSFWKSVSKRYVTLRAAQQPPAPKCAFFEKTTGFTTHTRRHKQKKKGELFPRARARK